MENLLTSVILTIGFILAGTHTTNAQCEFNIILFIIILLYTTHWDTGIVVGWEKKQIGHVFNRIIINGLIE